MQPVAMLLGGEKRSVLLRMVALDRRAYRIPVGNANSSELNCVHGAHQS